MFEKAGVPPLTLEGFRERFELPFVGFYKSHIPDIPIEQLEAWFHEAFSAEQDSVRPLNHAAEFLDYCQKMELRCFVLRPFTPDILSNIWHKLGLLPTSNKPTPGSGTSGMKSMRLWRDTH